MAFRNRHDVQPANRADALEGRQRTFGLALEPRSRQNAENSENGRVVYVGDTVFISRTAECPVETPQLPGRWVRGRVAA